MTRFAFWPPVWPRPPPNQIRTYARLPRVSVDCILATHFLYCFIRGQVNSQRYSSQPPVCRVLAPQAES